MLAPCSYWLNAFISLVNEQNYAVPVGFKTVTAINTQGKLFNLHLLE